MVTEQGVIETVRPRKALVRIHRSSACEGCKSRGACQSLSDREMLVEVENELSARAGDRVEISIPAGSLLKLSLLVYFIPIVAFLIGAYAGDAWSGALKMDAVLASVLLGGGAMALTFVMLRKMSRSAEGKGRYSPRITRIVSPGATEDSPESCDNI